MKNSKAIKKLVFLFLCLYSLNVAAQITISNLPAANFPDNIKSANESPEILSAKIKSFNTFPDLKKYTGQNVFVIHDDHFGDVPFRLFIPPAYDPAVRQTMVLYLHGAVKMSSFGDAAKTDKEVSNENDTLYTALCNSGYVVVMPYGDSNREFDWSSNKFKEPENYTFAALVRIIDRLKRSINIDDNKVFAFGHSDGSDGVFALDVYSPAPFAGFVAYNSMLANMFSSKIYIKNAVNRPLYLVHSDLDDLRPIESTRKIAKLLDSLKAPIQYKEYKGYTHQDKHLEKDLPYSLNFIKTVKRNPYPSEIYWETSSPLYNQCDWLIIKKWDITMPVSQWYRSYNVPLYIKRAHFWTVYYSFDPSAAIEAHYKNNLFTLSTSRVIKVELLISPDMVDFNKPVKVIADGKMIFNQKLNPDRDFIARRIATNFDRKAVWRTSINLELPGK